MKKSYVNLMIKKTLKLTQTNFRLGVLILSGFSVSQVYATSIKNLPSSLLSFYRTKDDPKDDKGWKELAHSTRPKTEMAKVLYRNKTSEELIIASRCYQHFLKLAWENAPVKQVQKALYLAAELGNEKAINKYLNAYKCEDYKFPKSSKVTLELAKKYIEEGSLEALKVYIKSYKNGFFSVEKKQNSQEHEGFFFLLKEAEKGNLLCYYSVLYCYTNQIFGLKQNDGTAINFLILQADMGNSLALETLLDVYNHPRFGVEPNSELRCKQLISTIRKYSNLNSLYDKIIQSWFEKTYRKKRSIFTKTKKNQEIADLLAKELKISTSKL